MLCNRCAKSFKPPDPDGISLGVSAGRVKISSYYGHSIYLDLCSDCAKLIMVKLQELEKEFTQALQNLGVTR